MIAVNSRFLNRKVTGLERYASGLCRALSRNSKEVRFFAHKGIVNEKTAVELQPRLTGKRKGYFWEQFVLPNRLKKIGSPPLLNPVNTAPFTYRDQITIVHDLAFIRNPEWFTRKAAMFFKYIVMKSIRNSERIAAVSRFTAGEIAEVTGIPEVEIIVIPGALDDDFLDLITRDYPSKYGEYILTVSTIEPRKNLRAIIDAFSKTARDDVKLVIAGGSSESIFSETRLKNIAAENKNIIFTGYITDEELAGLYSNASLFISASFYEGFGFPPLEAAAAGIPMLLSDIPAHREISGENAVYFDPHNTDDLAELIDEFFKGNLAVSTNELRNNVNRFSWDDSAYALLKLFAESFDSKL